MAEIPDADLASVPREELIERARALQTVLRVGQAVANARDVEDLANRFAEAVAAYTRFASVAVLRFVEAKGVFELVAQRGFDASKFPPPAALPLKGSLTGLAAERRQVLTTDDIATDQRLHPPTAGPLAANAYTSGACVPVINGGEVIGSFNLLFPRGTALGPSERRLLEALGSSLGVAMAGRIAAERERLLEEQARRAQQLESLGVVAGGIAHDFNNLLTGIVGHVDLARALAVDADAGRIVKLLEDALEASTRATALARQLLTFSRGGAPSRMATSDLGSLLREVSSFAARGTSVRCEVQIEEPLGVVEIDAGQIGQVIQNLVLNACQASPGGATVTVRAHAESRGAEGHRVLVEVIDRGCGIGPEDLPHIFEPFYTTRAGGTGLGLAVSHSIVKRHDGQLSVVSELGRGSTFTVELRGSDRPLAAPASAGSTVGRFSGRALVMDDEETVRTVATLLLSRLGFDVEVARHGAQALELARRAADTERPFRLALLDLTVVGGLGGAEIADDLRRECPGIRLIVSSGYAADGGDGWDARLPKPYSLEDLAAAVTRALEVT
jgi:signal transduction histidine kinase/CheY-like chemotaxis protein